MRLGVLLVMLFAVATACGRRNFNVPDAADDATVPDDLVMWFAFEDDGMLIDRAGGRVARCVSCPAHTDDGRIGKGLDFDGSGQCLTIGHEAALDLPAFTFMAWLSPRDRLTTRTAYARPFNATATDGNTRELFLLSSGSWNMAVHEAKIGSAVPAGWHHVAGVFDGVTFVAYIDGAQIGSGQPGPAVYTVEDELIGCDKNSGVLSSFFDGSIDELKLWSRALTAAEIGTLVAE